MCVEGGFFFKNHKRDSTFIREMRVVGIVQNIFISVPTKPGLWCTLQDFSNANFNPGLHCL